ncbi:hypothetical protein H7I53_11640 [Mycolicibacterium pulveris]|uniref:ESX-1 secretion-associated protein n=1 Tax=Mycolicibacterium pulveris TaxID=36813 RepID=A0A7I7UGX5_MYCPV|nr:type VII secretion target [Mycolicibacterium pulveris]MCV6980871.1 hypothetical protein [Mycolicibacterium pulveris]BBY80545.1 hypothetical protein MPUL_17030 [Mycolicibacterium pulveris]
MLVDPEILRVLAGQVDAASATVREADVGDKTSSAADGLPGSTTRWAVRLVGAHLAERAEAIAANLTELGRAVRGAGEGYEVTDAELAGSLDEIF